MKKMKLHTNLFAFGLTIVFLFISHGSWAHWKNTMLEGVISAKQIIVRIITGEREVFEAHKANIDEIAKTPEYHNQFMDLYSIKENLFGTRIITKDDSIVVKTASDMLVSPAKAVTMETLEDCGEQVARLKLSAEEQGAKFLFVSAPNKGQYATLPDNAPDASKSNYRLFLNVLREKNIPLVELGEELKAASISGEDMFFYTDHHWKPYTGFTANRIICEELNKRYGFSYNESYVDIGSYTVETYPDYFLGSYGKKTGTYFTWQGADDFDLILPKFETDFTESQPYKDQIRNGSFEETVLYMDNIARRDYYKLNTYAVYSGGDFRLQIMKNNLNPDGKTILLIRDSFACVVAPFLALQTNELHVCDVRDYSYYVGEKLNVEDYIQRIKPDYVLVLYSGCGSVNNGAYDFF